MIVTEMRSGRSLRLLARDFDGGLRVRGYTRSDGWMPWVCESVAELRDVCAESDYVVCEVVRGGLRVTAEVGGVR